MLIECPECKKQISSEASNCPNCGYNKLKEDSPLEVMIKKAIKDLFRDKSSDTKTFDDKIKKILPHFFIILLIIFLIAIYNKETCNSAGHPTYLKAVEFEKAGDKKKAAKFYYDAYVQGDVHATYKMGEIKEGAIIKSYEYGTWEDINEAIKLYQMANSLGHPDAAEALRKVMERKREGGQ